MFEAYCKRRVKGSVKCEERIEECGVADVSSTESELHPESKGLSAMKAASKIAEKNEITDMTLDEINEEISAARTN